MAKFKTDLEYLENARCHARKLIVTTGFPIEPDRDAILYPTRSELYQRERERADRLDREDALMWMNHLMSDIVNRMAGRPNAVRDRS